MSASGDLAYSYGSYGEPAKVESGHYLTIWQTNGVGEWKIILDLQKPTPK